MQDDSPIDFRKITVDPLKIRVFRERDIEAEMLRLDKVHPVISGNKWFKLKYHLAAATARKAGELITFGGPWSNHIVATACAANSAAMGSLGMIRGERPANLSPILQTAGHYGMTFRFLSRTAYAGKNEAGFLNSLQAEFPDSYILPEGGAGEAGRRGCEEILSLVTRSRYSHIVCAVGTGTLFLGLVNAADRGQKIEGIPVWKGFRDLPGFLEGGQKKWENLEDCHVHTQYHFGGYAAKNSRLTGFMNEFFRETGIPTDFVYTGKLCYGVHDLVASGYFPGGSRLLIIHSGGLMGNLSLPAGELSF
jgi:1-aminocyclopropane-1-carboxylate deaminase